MWEFVGSIAILIFTVSLIATIVFGIKKDARWKKSLATTGIAFLILMVAAAADSPEPKPVDTSDKSAIETSSTQGNDAAETDKLISAQVVRVIDGDTLEVTINGKTDKIRLIGVDTPETVHPNQKVEPYGKEASEFTKSQLNGKTVSLEFDAEKQDKYGRLLAYVWMEDKLFNETLLKEGYAQVSTYPPNVKYVEKFTAAQTEARNNNRGLWAVQEEKPASVPAVASSPTTIVSPESQLQTEPQTITVYVTRTGEKYHSASCRYLSRSQIPMSLSDAKAAGYTPCSVCGPPQ
jgi:micrococcal nuclease